MAHQIYMSDAAKAIVENTARFAGGSILGMRFAELIDNAKKKEDPRSGDEIVNHMKQKIAALAAG